MYNECMNQELQFFVLDLSMVVMGTIIIALIIISLVMHKKLRGQKKLLDALDGTVNRILAINDSGGIDGREVALKERRRESRKPKR